MRLNYNLIADRPVFDIHGPVSYESWTALCKLNFEKIAEIPSLYVRNKGKYDMVLSFTFFIFTHLKQGKEKCTEASVREPKITSCAIIFLYQEAGLHSSL